MTLFTTDFAGYTAGQQPSDWSVQWHTGTFTVEDGAQAVLGGKYLQFSHSSTNRYGLSWDAAGSVLDGEILALLRPESAGASVWAGTLVLRGSGTGSGETGYFCCLENQTLQVCRFLSAGFAVLASPSFSYSAEAGVWVRFQVVGQNLKARSWLDGETEPAAWMVEVSDSSVTGAGWVGVEGAGCDVDWDWFGVDTAGATVPLPGAVATPVMAPAGGVIPAGSTVAITCTTEGATIYYTTDGSTPTTASAVYSGPITITTATTIKALAVKAGLDDSAVVSGSYSVATVNRAKIFVIT